MALDDLLARPESQAYEARLAMLEAEVTRLFEACNKLHQYVSRLGADMEKLMLMAPHRSAGPSNASQTIYEPFPK